MLMQSYGNTIELLPALPQAWATGSMRGLKARGGYELNFSWMDGKISTVEIESPSRRKIALKCNGITKVYKLKKGKNNIQP